MTKRKVDKREENSYPTSMTRKEYDRIMYEQRREEICRQIKRDKAMYGNKEDNYV